MSTSKRKNNGVQLPWNDLDFINKWQEWLQYRAERNLARYVPTGLKRTFTKLFNDAGGNPQTAIAIIDQSLSMGWQGLFPVKEQQNSQNGKQYGQKSTAVNDDILKQKLAERIRERRQSSAQ